MMRTVFTILMLAMLLYQPLTRAGKRHAAATLFAEPACVLSAPQSCARSSAVAGGAGKWGDGPRRRREPGVAPRRAVEKPGWPHLLHLPILLGAARRESQS